jgi:hypothetical protein
MHLMSVDLPEPDKPITTKVSPLATSKDTSRTPTVHPVSVSTSALVAPVAHSSMARCGCCPKTFQAP